MSLKPAFIFEFHLISLNFLRRAAVGGHPCIVSCQHFLGNSCGLLSDMKTPAWCLQKTSPLHAFLLFQWRQNWTAVRSQPKIYSPRAYGSVPLVLTLAENILLVITLVLWLYIVLSGQGSLSNWDYVLSGLMFPIRWFYLK